MSRREVIAITVVINVVLLAVLFFTADRLENDIENSAVSQTYEPIPIAIPDLITASDQENLNPGNRNTKANDMPVDEVDSVLRDFAAAVAASQQMQQASANPESQPRQQAPFIASAPAIKPPVPITIPPTPQVPPPTSNSSYNEVVVQKGDFLQKIALKNGTTIEAIKAANGLTSDNLRVGQVLRVPQNTVVKPTQNRRTQEVADGQFYKVKSGDSPWKIAKQNNVSLEELLKLNQLNEETAKNLKPGDTLRVR